MTAHSIVITGASSGLGAALAESYANKGVTLHLAARNKTRLKHVKQVCEAKGATVYAEVVDVTDEQKMKAWIAQSWKLAPFDLVIANAGISAGTSGVEGKELAAEPIDQIKKIFDVDITGVIHTLSPAVEHMLSRAGENKGQIAVISSLAGLRGLPSSPAYSAAKAAVRVYGDALRGMLIHHGIAVSVVIPGYIQTPMTAVNNFPMPSLVTANAAANTIKKGLQKRKAQIVFPKMFAMMVCFLALLPVWLTDPVFARLPGKPSF